MQVSLIGPDASLYEGEADSLVAPAYDGDVGILPRHAPFMTLLGRGELVVKHAGQVHRFTVHGGFLQVVSDRVRVVAEHVAPAGSGGAHS
jgi:F-type H+-transporting ATPase subunit epsilon